MGCQACSSLSEPARSSTVHDPLHRLQQALRQESEAAGASLTVLIPSMRAEVSQGEQRCEDLQRTIATLQGECEELRRSQEGLTEDNIRGKQRLVGELEDTLAEIKAELVQTKARLSDFEELKAKVSVYEEQICELTAGLHAFESKEATWLQDKADLEQKVQALKLKQAVVRKAKLHYDSELSEKLVASHIEVRRLADETAFLSVQTQSLIDKRAKSLRLYTLTLIQGNWGVMRRSAFLAWKGSIRRLPDSSERKPSASWWRSPRLGTDTSAESKVGSNWKPASLSWKGLYLYPLRTL